MQHHNYSLYDLEHMIPYEREIYVSLLAEHLQQEKEQKIAQQRRWEEELEAERIYQEEQRLKKLREAQNKCHQLQ